MGSRTFMVTMPRAPASRGKQLKERGRADGRTAASFRMKVDEWIHGAVTVSPERRADIILATDEALSNCAEHAYRGADTCGPMSLGVTLDHAKSVVTVCVEDEGAWTEPAAHPTQSARGRGLLLMKALADDITIDGRDDGTTICMRFAQCYSRPTSIAGGRRV
jgi:anti-sigma regulatory factor (Ser/Thr protein kinase)